MPTVLPTHRKPIVSPIKDGLSLTNSRLPDNAIYHFCVQAKKYGVDIFRIFDALNDIDQLEVGIKAVQEAGGVVEATVCYSGDSE